MEFEEFASLEFKPLSSDILSSGIEVDSSKLFQKICDTLQEIVNEKFINSNEKRRINFDLDGRINFACPYCGDSQRDERAKRGNIYKANFNFKCYNCSEFRSFRSFLKDFHKEDGFDVGELAHLRELSEEIAVSSTGNFSGSAGRGFIQLMFISEYGIPRADIMQRGKYAEVTRVPEIYKILQERKQIPENGDFRHFAYCYYSNSLIFLNLTKDRNHVIGLQHRFMKPRPGQIRFMSYTYSDIWKKLFDIDIKQDIKDLMDKFSQIYNILGVNLGFPVTIFESSIDSHHLSNSAAMWGASKRIYIPGWRYFFDNSRIDKAGQKAAMNALEAGMSVFLWDKFLDDYPQFENCKDLNDIFKKETISENLINQYFSNNPLDLIYI